jgi:hypothetical protein
MTEQEPWLISSTLTSQIHPRLAAGSEPSLPGILGSVNGLQENGIDGETRERL